PGGDRHDRRAAGEAHQHARTAPARFVMSLARAFGGHMSADSRIDTTTYAVIMAALDLDLPPRGVLAATATLAELFDARVVGAAAGECSLAPYFAEGPVAEK